MKLYGKNLMQDIGQLSIHFVNAFQHLLLDSKSANALCVSPIPLLISKLHKLFGTHQSTYFFLGTLHTRGLYT